MEKAKHLLKKAFPLVGFANVLSGFANRIKDIQDQSLFLFAVDGGWGDWTAWSTCSASCGPGTSIRSRQCNNPPPGPGGKQCTGLPVGNRPCNEGACPGSTYQTVS